MRRIAILGAGAFGTALAAIAARAGRDVVLWGRDALQIADIAQKRQNLRYLPGITLPAGISVTADLATALTADVLVAAIPTQALRSAVQTCAPLLRPGVPLVAAAKGIEQASGCFVMEILRSTAPLTTPAILSGPSFAADMARGLPTAVTLAAENAEISQRLAAVLSGPGFRIYHSDDVIGVEIGGAAKNVLAIAAGIVIGAGLGESARAALIARGFAELTRFAKALGARSETLMGLSGLGDLVLTAASPQSRNFAFGRAVGEGQDIARLLATGKLAEGAFTAPALVTMARARGVEMPISEAVSAVLAGRISVRDAVAGLIERPQKAE